MSREHAAIVPIGNDHILEDLRSANGTVVNGTRLSRRILQHGDVMEFGQFHLRYLNPKVAADIDLERTMLIEGLSDKSRAASRRRRADRRQRADAGRGHRRARTFRRAASGWARARAPAR